MPKSVCKNYHQSWNELSSVNVNFSYGLAALAQNERSPLGTEKGFLLKKSATNSQVVDMFADGLMRSQPAEADRNVIDTD